MTRSRTICLEVAFSIPCFWTAEQTAISFVTETSSYSPVALPSLTYGYGLNQMCLKSLKNLTDLTMAIFQTSVQVSPRLLKGWAQGWLCWLCSLSSLSSSSASLGLCTSSGRAADCRGEVATHIDDLSRHRMTSMTLTVFFLQMVCNIRVTVLSLRMVCTFRTLVYMWLSSMFVNNNIML